MLDNAACCSVPGKAMDVPQQDKIKPVLDLIPAAVFILEPDSARCILANRLAIDWLGYSQSELMAIPFPALEAVLDLSAPEVWTQMIENAKQYPPGGFKYKANLRRKDARILPVEVTLGVTNHNSRDLLMASATEMRDQQQRPRSSGTHSQTNELPGSYSVGIHFAFDRAMNLEYSSIPLLGGVTGPHSGMLGKNIEFLFPGPTFQALKDAAKASRRNGMQGQVINTPLPGLKATYDCIIEPGPAGVSVIAEERPDSTEDQPGAAMQDAAREMQFLCSFNKCGRFEAATGHIEDLLNYTLEDILDLSLCSVDSSFLNYSAAEFRQWCLRIHNERKSRVYRTRFLGSKAKLCDLQVTATTLQIAGRSFLLIIAREWLANSRKQTELPGLAKKERFKLSRNLHDTVAQELTVADFAARTIRKKLPEPWPSELQLPVERLQQSLGRAKRQTRLLINHLEPVHETFRSAFAMSRSFLSDLKALYGTDVQFESDLSLKEVRTGLNTHHVHLVREAIFNAVQHGKASKVLVQMKKTDLTDLLVEVHDNGAGSVPFAKRKNELGEGTIPYRTMQLGGQTHFTDSSLLGGFCVVCRLPFIGRVL